MVRPTSAIIFTNTAIKQLNQNNQIMKRHLMSISALFLALVLMYSCNSSDINGKTNVESITIDKESIEMVRGGASVRLTAKVLPEDADYDRIYWESDNSSVISVDREGNVTAVAAGTAKVLATAGNKTDECTVTVLGKEVEKITLNTSLAILQPGDEIQLEAEIQPRDADYSSVEWSSSNDGIASVSQDGKVTAIAEGNAEITIKAGGMQAVCEIKVKTAKVGYFYFSDGTYSDKVEDGKECIGIIFYVGQHPNDNSDYSETGIGKAKCNGYVAALHDANSEMCMWGPSGLELGLYPTDEEGNVIDNFTNNSGDNDWSGYKYTQIIIQKAKSFDGLNSISNTGFPATYYTVNYEDIAKAPANTSGWFLPAISQLVKVMDMEQTFAESDIADPFVEKWYASSSEKSNSAPERFTLIAGPDAKSTNINYDYKQDYNYIVRPVLAF